MIQFWIWFFSGLGLCYILDSLSVYLFKWLSLIENISQNTRWFFIHFVINMFVSLFGLQDMRFCLNNMAMCGLTPWINGYIAYGLAISLHIYHMLAFKLTNMDWLHHISSAIISGPIMLLYCTNSSAVVALWFMSGFPGMIDYLLLWLVKLGYIKSKIEKKIYVWLSVWVRAPGCIMAVVFQLSSFGIGLGWMNMAAIIWMMFIVYWNGLFFMSMTLKDYYINEGREREKLKNVG